MHKYFFFAHGLQSPWFQRYWRILPWVNYPLQRNSGTAVESLLDFSASDEKPIAKVVTLLEALAVCSSVTLATNLSLIASPWRRTWKPTKSQMKTWRTNLPEPLSAVVLWYFDRAMSIASRLAAFVYGCMLLWQLYVNMLLASEASRMEVFQLTLVVILMICCYDLFLAWFCTCDFDMVSVLILIWVKIVFWCGPKVWFPILWRFCMVTTGIASKSQQNRIKTISISSENHKSPRKIGQKHVPGLFLSFLWSQPIGTISKSNHIHIKTYQDRVETISKLYQNHKNLQEVNQKPVPGLFLFPWLKPTHREPWKRRSVPKPCQNNFKIMTKPYRSHNPKFKAY